MSSQVYSVGQISSIIEEVMRGSLFQNIYIRGEVQSLNQKGNYIYLTLIDPTSFGNVESSLTVVISKYCEILTPGYKVGDTLLMKGSMNYYKARGSVSFWPRNLIVDGLGQELLRLKLLKEKLQKEGLFEPSHKRALPRFVNQVAIITSSEGAAINDILASLKKRFPVRIAVYSTLVQGSLAAKSIVNNLLKAYSDRDNELIILTRGGGSKADLAPFDDEQVARTVFQAPVPIISAVGHEIDTSICDLVADAVAITPTAAAELVGLSLEELASSRERIRKQIDEIIIYALNSARDRQINYALRLESLSPREKLRNLEERMLKYSNEFKNAISFSLQAAFLRFASYKRELESISPTKILERGYAFISKEGKMVKKSADLHLEDIIKITFSDGEIDARITKTEGGER